MARERFFKINPLPFLSGFLFSRIEVLLKLIVYRPVEFSQVVRSALIYGAEN